MEWSKSGPLSKGAADQVLWHLIRGGFAAERYGFA